MLVVCRLALAALLILGPVFIVLALFDGTRGLFEGWLKSVAMFALVPLLTVVMGSGALVAIAPMVAGLDQSGGQIPLRTAVSILVASIIYLSLMLVVFKVAATLTRSWRLGRSSAAAHGASRQLRRKSSGTPALAPRSGRGIADDRDCVGPCAEHGREPRDHVLEPSSGCTSGSPAGRSGACSSARTCRSQRCAQPDALPPSPGCRCVQQ